MAEGQSTRKRGRPPLDPDRRALKVVPVRFTQDQHDALKELAEERVTTVSDIVTMAIDAFVDKAGLRPIVLNFSNEMYLSLLRLAREGGHKNDIRPIVMQAVASYVEAEPRKT